MCWWYLRHHTKNHFFYTILLYTNSWTQWRNQQMTDNPSLMRWYRIYLLVTLEHPSIVRKLTPTLFSTSTATIQLAIRWGKMAAMRYLFPIPTPVPLFALFYKIKELFWVCSFVFAFQMKGPVHLQHEHGYSSSTRQPAVELQTPIQW